MQFEYNVFHIDCRTRRASDGHYFARVRITRGPGSEEDRVETHDSGDIDSFVRSRCDLMRKGMGCQMVRRKLRVSRARRFRAHNIGDQHG